MKVSDIFSKSVISFGKKKHQPGQQVPLTWHSIEILIGSSSRIIISWLSYYIHSLKPTVCTSKSAGAPKGRFHLYPPSFSGAFGASFRECNPETKYTTGVITLGAFGCNPLTAYILLMAEILHLGCIKPYKQWDIYHINWCRISTINSMTPQQSTIVLTWKKNTTISAPSRPFGRSHGRWR